MDVSAVAKAGSTPHQGTDALELGVVSAFDHDNAPHVSISQRDRWRKNGVCVRCGLVTHWVSECAQRPTVSQTAAVNLSNSEDEMGLAF
ncbi:hypothetical protein K469DRAFT_760191 [Zopfia rhizophila CBS 207.26]|uniref:CCHC-type domain-containing protein n=1 Tax=Zopfia rhizophila CBS 207.26 TaxID=1314779 RepID=A0A6A6EHL2_9PEZI|nr:hypothetical protein K469DRAFT_760191 [Zopfia rhizophila CBS 207.26]